MHIKFIFVATEASTEAAFAILLPPGEWPLAWGGAGRRSLGLRWSWGDSPTLPGLEDVPAQPRLEDVPAQLSWSLLPSQVLALGFQVSGQRDKAFQWWWWGYHGPGAWATAPLSLQKAHSLPYGPISFQTSLPHSLTLDRRRM